MAVGWHRVNALLQKKPLTWRGEVTAGVDGIAWCWEIGWGFWIRTRYLSVNSRSHVPYVLIPKIMCGWWIRTTLRLQPPLMVRSFLTPYAISKAPLYGCFDSEKISPDANDASWERAGDQLDGTTSKTRFSCCNKARRRAKRRSPLPSFLCT
jgi:hypothetical protein